MISSKVYTNKHHNTTTCYIGGFFCARCLDLFSTYLCLHKYGYNPDAELNPLYRFESFTAFVLVNLGVSLIGFSLLKKRPVVIKAVTIMSLLVSVYNFLIFIFI